MEMFYIDPGKSEVMKQHVSHPGRERNVGRVEDEIKDEHPDKKHGQEGDSVNETLLAISEVAQDGFAWKNEPALDEGEIMAGAGYSCADAMEKRSLVGYELVAADALADSKIVGQNILQTIKPSDRIQYCALHAVKHTIDC